jgi:hypothetical protein
LFIFSLKNGLCRKHDVPKPTEVVTSDVPAKFKQMSSYQLRDYLQNIVTKRIDDVRLFIRQTMPEKSSSPQQSFLELISWMPNSLPDIVKWARLHYIVNHHLMYRYPYEFNWSFYGGCLIIVIVLVIFWFF